MSARDLIILGTSSQQPTRYRNHGGYLFRINNEGLLFDPGEGTQRQFIFADVAPPTVTRILVSHFHGDHCLGLGSFLMRLNLDNVEHEIHVYYPASGKKYFDRLRYGTIYHEKIKVIEHPVEKAGVIHDDGKFKIETDFLVHGVDNLGWRITEPDTRKFSKEKLLINNVRGPLVKEIEEKGQIIIDGKLITLDDVSHIRKGDSFAVIIDTRLCPQAISLASNAEILLCESTYLEEHKDLAYKHYHLTAKQAASIALEAQAKKLILTHYSARYVNSKAFEIEAREVFEESYAANDLDRFLIPKNK